MQVPLSARYWVLVGITAGRDARRLAGGTPARHATCRHDRRAGAPGDCGRGRPRAILWPKLIRRISRDPPQVPVDIPGHVVPEVVAQAAVDLEPAAAPGQEIANGAQRPAIVPILGAHGGEDSVLDADVLPRPQPGLEELEDCRRGGGEMIRIFNDQERTIDRFEERRRQRAAEVARIALQEGDGGMSDARRRLPVDRITRRSSPISAAWSASHIALPPA